METQGQPITVRRSQWTSEHLVLLCGIANGGGGTLVIESNSKSYTSGLRKMRRPFEQIPRLVANELGLECSTEPVLDGAALCLEITVPEAPEPIAYEGRYWFYDGERNIQSSRDAIQAMRDEAATGGAGSPWEMRLQPTAQQKDLNAGEFLAVAALETDNPDLSTDTLDTMLDRRLTLLNLKHPRTHSMTNAGILLLHNSPEQFIPGAWVQLQLFAQSDDAMLQNEVKGPLAHQLKESMRLLFEQYLPMAVATPGAAADSAITLNFPPRDALRDALLNALAHKGYERELPVRICVHPDRVVIISPRNAAGNEGLGAMGSAVPEVMLPDSANPPNPVLTNALLRLGIMDDRDLSPERLTAQCAEVGLDAPVFQHDSNGISIVFSLKPNAGQSNTATPPPRPFFGTHRREFRKFQGDGPRGAGECGCRPETRHCGTGRQRSQECAVLGAVDCRRQQPGPHFNR